MHKSSHASPSRTRLKTSQTEQALYPPISHVDVTFYCPTHQPPGVGGDRGEKVQFYHSWSSYIQSEGGGNRPPSLTARIAAWPKLSTFLMSFSRRIFSSASVDMTSHSNAALRDASRERACAFTALPRRGLKEPEEFSKQSRELLEL